jgi:hypothetical protein
LIESNHHDSIMAKQAVWVLRYVAGNPAMFTNVTTAAGGPMRRGEAVTEAKAVAANNPKWRIWVEHEDEPGRRIYQSAPEAEWLVKQEHQRVADFAAKLEREAPGYIAAHAAAKLEQAGEAVRPKSERAKKNTGAGRITLDQMISFLEGLRDDHGGDAPVFVDGHRGSIHRPSLRADRASTGGGPDKLVSRQGVACIVIGGQS